MRSILFLFLFSFGCGDEPAEDGACEMVAALEGCPECADGDVTCSFEEYEVTEMSCGGCQAESSLLKALCDADSSATTAEITSGMVCVDTESPD